MQENSNLHPEIQGMVKVEVVWQRQWQLMEMGLVELLITPNTNHRN